MKRTVTGIGAAALALGAMVAPGERVRSKDGRLTGGYMLGPVAPRGQSRQAFKAVANHKPRRKRR